MGQIQKQGTFNTISSFVGIALGAVNTIFLYPIAFAGKEDEWGLIRLLFSYGLVVSVFANLGVSRGLTRFIPYHPNEKDGLISFGIRISFIGFLGVLGLSFLFKEPILDWISADPLFAEYAQLTLVLTGILMFSELFGGIFQGMIRTRLPQFLNEVGVRLGVTFLLLLQLVIKMPLDIFLWIFLGIYLVRGGILIGILLKDYGINMKASLSPETRRNLMKFGFIALFSGSTSVLLVNIDQLFIGKYLSLEKLTIYGMAIFMASVIQAPARALTTISTPVLSRAWANMNKENIAVIYSKSALNQMIIGGIVYCVILLNLDVIFEYLLPPFYAEGAQIFVFVGLARVIGVSMGANGMVLLTSSKFRANLVFNVILLTVTVLSNAILVPRFGLMGAAWAFIINIATDNLFRMVYLHAQFKIQPFSTKTIAGVLYVIIPFLVLYWLPIPGNPWVLAITKTAVYGLLMLVILLKTSLSLELRDTLLTMLKKVGVSLK